MKGVVKGGPRARVGLVLGAGGFVGGAWLIGALDAVARATGWEPHSAEYIVGTSAGSMIGSVCGAGISPSYLADHPMCDLFEGLLTAPQERGGGGEAAVYRIHRGLPGIGSASLLFSTLRNPRRHPPGAALASLLPHGLLSTDPLRQTIERVAPGGWLDHPNLWVMACDYGNGRRVAFGRPGEPKVDLAGAVAASCAVPGFYRPVRLDGRDYIDGGVCSCSNLDLLKGLGLDLVLCLNPMSCDPDAPSTSVSSRLANVFRRSAGRRLEHEAEKVRESGTSVVLLQPGVEDLAVMGMNLMSTANLAEVMETASRSIGRELSRRVPRSRLAVLSASARPIPGRRRRPTWADLKTA